LVEGFTKQYNIRRLVYFEVHDSIRDAIQREKNMKHWPRIWKTRLIILSNPTWRDLYDEMNNTNCQIDDSSSPGLSRRSRSGCTIVPDQSGWPGQARP
jgi:hypothetical protein